MESKLPHISIEQKREIAKKYLPFVKVIAKKYGIGYDEAWRELAYLVKLMKKLISEGKSDEITRAFDQRYYDYEKIEASKFEEWLNSLDEDTRRKTIEKHERHRELLKDKINNSQTP